jgi:FeS assembly SUF system regulator
MLRLSKLTDYALVIMAYLAKHPGSASNAKHIAEKTGISLPTASKLLKRLSGQQLLLAQRGIKGGYQLALPASDISLGKIIQSLDGPIALTECSHVNHPCSVEKQCTIRDNWRRISAFIQDTLLHISIADLIKPLKLDSLLNPALTIQKNRLLSQSPPELATKPRQGPTLTDRLQTPISRVLVNAEPQQTSKKIESKT